jgi:hypothetical protein
MESVGAVISSRLAQIRCISTRTLGIERNLLKRHKMHIRKALRGAIAAARFILLLLLSIISVEAIAASPAGTYSSLQYNQEGGDLLGYEVLIIPTDVGYKAVVQVAEGSPGEVYIVELHMSDGYIHFDIPLSSGKKESFSGQVRGQFLIGDITSPSGIEHVRLKHGSSYWDK